MNWIYCLIFLFQDSTIDLNSTKFQDRHLEKEIKTYFKKNEYETIISILGKSPEKIKSHSTLAYYYAASNVELGNYSSYYHDLLLFSYNQGLKKSNYYLFKLEYNRYRFKEARKYLLKYKESLNFFEKQLISLESDFSKLDKAEMNYNEIFKINIPKRTNKTGLIAVKPLTIAEPHKLFINSLFDINNRNDSIENLIYEIKVRLENEKEESIRRSLFTNLRIEKDRLSLTQKELERMSVAFPNGLIPSPDGSSNKKSLQDEFIINSELSVIDTLDKIPGNHHLVYMIQLGAFSISKQATYFNGISPVFFEFSEEQNVTKYFAGRIYKYENATKYLKQAQKFGFPKAYLVAFYEGKKIPVDKAIALEKHLLTE